MYQTLNSPKHSQKMHPKPREFVFLFLTLRKIYTTSLLSRPLQFALAHTLLHLLQLKHCAPNLPLLILNAMSRYQLKHNEPKRIIKQMQLGSNQTKQQSYKPRSNANKQETKINLKQPKRINQRPNRKSNYPKQIPKSHKPLLYKSMERELISI